MNKEKQFDIVGRYHAKNDLANALYQRQDDFDISNPFEVANCVINLGYRKINENEVVISKEEYEELINLQQTHAKDLTNAIQSYEEKKADLKLEYNNHIKNLEKIIDRQSKDLNSQANRLIDLKEKIEQARKETAEKIFSELYMYVSRDYLCGLRNPYKSNNYMGLVERLAKQFGVEIKE